MDEGKSLSGAESLVKTLVDADVDVCFANPGTSEMHFVAALDSNPDMRCVLGLFEGVVTGAADGYGRMAGKPAVTLTHLGPGNWPLTDQTSIFLELRERLMDP